jgi:aryl-alcohol dehydrogenase-like predicted oxidoreductase
VPIPGTTKVSRLQENVGAARLHLDDDDLRSINAALAALRVHGARYPSQLQALVGR